MKNLKNNLRQILDFLTYFDNNFPVPRIKSKNNNIFLNWQNEEKDLEADVFIFEGTASYYDINGAFVTVNLSKMEDRIRLVNYIKEFIKL